MERLRRSPFARRLGGHALPPSLGLSQNSRPDWPGCRSGVIRALDEPHHCVTRRLAWFRRRCRALEAESWISMLAWRSLLCHQSALGSRLPQVLAGSARGEEPVMA